MLFLINGCFLVFEYHPDVYVCSITPSLARIPLLALGVGYLVSGCGGGGEMFVSSLFGLLGGSHMLSGGRQEVVVLLGW